MSRGAQLSLKQKIRSVTSTMHMTRAMEMVATARLQHLRKNLKNFYEYEREFSYLFEKIVSSIEDLSDVSDLISNGPISHVLLVVIAGDMGLCGAYNDNVIFESYRVADGLGKDFAGFYVIGSKAKSRMIFDGKQIFHSMAEMYSRPSYDDAQSFANELIKLYRNKNIIDSIEIIHGYSKNSLVQGVKREPFLPVKIDKHSKTSMYDYEPEASELLEIIMPQYFGARMYRIFLESRISEHNARQNAMRNATDNAKKLIEDLTLKYNKERQNYITQEVVEVTNGSEFLKGEN